MSIVEQAVRRLEELRRSGIEHPASFVAPERAAAPSTAPRRATPGPADASDSILPADAAGGASRKVHIDLARLAAAGYLTPEAPRARIADEFRVVKRPLLEQIGRTSGQIGWNLLMVSSALPGEGKTFVSINLAMSLAMELDKTVLLVDADVARPAVLSRLGLPQSSGLMDLLTDPAVGVADVMLRTNVPKLSILPAGRPHARATELLASESMQRLLAELSTRYSDRILVFDAPPLLPSTESRVLASQVGQVVLVVEANHTSQRTLEQALATVEQCPTVWPLLNKVSRSEVGSYHGYYSPMED